MKWETIDDIYKRIKKFPFTVKIKENSFHHRSFKESNNMITFIALHKGAEDSYIPKEKYINNGEYFYVGGWATEYPDFCLMNEKPNCSCDRWNYDILMKKPCPHEKG